MTEIRNFEELERELGELIGSAGGCYDDAIKDALELVNSLKASVGKRIVDSEKTIRNLGDNPHVRMKLDEFLKSKMLELRKVLGKEGK